MPGSGFKTAVEISEELLEITGAAMLASDFDTFVQYFILPHYVETFEGHVLIATKEEFKLIFDAVRMHYRLKGVTEIVRRCVSAEFKDDKTILATHETRLLNGAQLAQKPFPAFSILHLDGARWKIKSCVYAIEDAPEHNKALMKSMAG
jgi:hypothetical protein